MVEHLVEKEKEEKEVEAVVEDKVEAEDKVEEEAKEEAEDREERGEEGMGVKMGRWDKEEEEVKVEVENKPQEPSQETALLDLAKEKVPIRSKKIKERETRQEREGDPRRPRSGSSVGLIPHHVTVCLSSKSG